MICNGNSDFVSQTITPEQAMELITYTSFNFDNVWGIDEGKSLPYLVFSPQKK